MKRKLAYISAAAIVVTFGGVAAGSVFSIRNSSESDVPAYVDDGQTNLDQVPAFIPVADQTGTAVGYSRREDVFLHEFQPELLHVEPGKIPDEPPVPVFAEANIDSTIVGHVFVEIGFVPLDQQTDPDFSSDKARVDVNTFETDIFDSRTTPND